MSKMADAYMSCSSKIKISINHSSNNQIAVLKCKSIIIKK